MPSAPARFALGFAVCALPVVVTAQEAVRFGAWRAFCAPVAGCVLGVNSDDGDTLAFVEPPNGDDHLLLIPRDPVAEGARIAVSFDGRPPVLIGADGGWRAVESDVGPAVRIAPDVVRERLAVAMLRRYRMTVEYRLRDDTIRRMTFPLNGYADTRGYTDDE